MVLVQTKAPAFDATAADRGISFIKSLKQHKGEWAGKTLDLMPWQEEPLRKLFGTMNPDGTRQYRYFWLEVARKNGKTTLDAGIQLYLLFADGEMGAEVYSAANDREQAALVYQEAAPMIRQSPALLSRSKIIDSRKRIIVPGTNSFYQVLSAETYTKWGINAHGIGYDELHAAPDRGLWDALTTSQGARRQPIIGTMTTAGFDRHSLAWEQHEYALKVRDGIVDDPSFLPIIYSTPEDDDWTDEDNWYKANPALGYFRYIDEMRILCRKAMDSPAEEMVFRRLFLNQWTTIASRWIQMAKWDACRLEALGPEGMDNLLGHACYTGLDLSSTTDLTAVVHVFPRDDGTYAFLPRFFIPKETMYKRAKQDRVPYPLWVQQGHIIATEGNVIDYDAIKLQLIKDRERFNIKQIKYDRWGATKLVQDLEKEDFLCVPMGQGFSSMSPPTKEFEVLVLGGLAQHDGHPVLRWNLDNTYVAQDPAGNLKPDKSKSTERIDGVVAAIMGLDGATRHDPSAGRSVYDERGIQTT